MRNTYESTRRAEVGGGVRSGVEKMDGNFSSQSMPTGRGEGGRPVLNIVAATGDGFFGLYVTIK
jgi:hypothetical protein